MTVHDSADPTTRSTARPPAAPAGAAPAGATPAPAPTRHPMIGALTGVRALAGVWVVLDHLQVAVAELLPALRVLTPPIWSYFCAEMFFILSGFVVAYNYIEKVRTGGGYRSYLWGRFARTYPAFLTTLLVAGVLAVEFPDDYRALAGPGFPYTGENLVANLLLMQSLPGFRPINGGSWFIGCVFVAYVLFPLLAWWLRRLSPRAALAWAGAVLAAGVLAVIATAPPTPMWVMTPHEMWLRVGTEFTAGALLYVWWRGRDRTSLRWDVVAIAAVAAVVALSYFLPPRVDPHSFLAMPLIALFIVACASSAGPVARVLSNRPMQWGGRLSYPLILAHGPVILLYQQVLHWDDIDNDALALRVGWLLVLGLWIVGSAVALHHLVELPARDRMLAWYAARGTTRTRS